MKKFTGLFFISLLILTLNFNSFVSAEDIIDEEEQEYTATEEDQLVTEKLKAELEDPTLAFNYYTQTQQITKESFDEIVLKEQEKLNDLSDSTDSVSINGGDENFEPFATSVPIGTNKVISSVDSSLAKVTKTSQLNATRNAWTSSKNMYAWTSAAGVGYANATARVGKEIYVTGRSGRNATITFSVYRTGLLYAAGAGSSYKIKGYVVRDGTVIASTTITSASRSVAVPGVHYQGSVKRGLQVYFSPNKTYRLYVRLEAESQSWGQAVWTYSMFGETWPKDYYASLNSFTIDWD